MPASVISDLDAGLLVVADALLEEVGLALQRNHVHPLEGVLDVVLLGHTETEQETVGDEFDVLAHQTGVHTDKFDGQGLGDEVVLDAHSLANDF